MLEGELITGERDHRVAGRVWVHAMQIDAPTKIAPGDAVVVGNRTDAQRLAMSGRNTPDPRHARPLDDSVARLDRAIATLEGRHPDYWHFLTETEAVRQTVAHVVAQIREERGGA